MALTINGIKVAGKGKDGVGVVAGGTSGQILTKKSNADYDTEWTTLTIPSEYVTETELNAKGYLTEHQSLDGLATESYVTEQIAAIPEPDLSSKQDKITGIAGQTVEFDSTGSLVAVNKEATSSTIIRVW